jgi:hypothetical protein
MVEQMDKSKLSASSRIQSFADVAENNKQQEYILDRQNKQQEYILDRQNQYKNECN